jgi:glycosyltransferase involved in cell wall biosynthesis
MTSVDVIVPCYNYGSMLEGCVQSILTQQGVAVRIFIVDDASSDETPEVGRRLARTDLRVQYWRHSVNQGHIHSYNEALARVTASYCVILSADDLLTPGSLLRATRIMEAHPQVGLAYGRDIPFRDTPPIAGGPFPRVCNHSILDYGTFLERACRLGHTGIQAPSAIVRTSLHKAIGGYLPELPHSGDTEIWLRMAARAPVAELQADQAYRRLHSRSMSLTYSPLERLREQRRAFEIHFADVRPDHPDVDKVVPVVARTIAESAFWSAVRAFEGEQDRLCETFLAFAAETDPGMTSLPAWRRLRWKRRAGRAALRWLTPLARLRQATWA